MVDELLLRAVVADRQRRVAQQRLVRAARAASGPAGLPAQPARWSEASVWDAPLSSFARVAATR